jgi:hypothetical protein
MPVSSKVPKTPKYSKADIAAGTKHEMEHTKDRTVAKRIAVAHLNEHWSYYRVLPIAESMMNVQENKALPKPKRRRKAPARGPAGLPLWGQMPF